MKDKAATTALLLPSLPESNSILSMTASSSFSFGSSFGLDNVFCCGRRFYVRFLIKESGFSYVAFIYQWSFDCLFSLQTIGLLQVIQLGDQGSIVLITQSCT